MSTPILSLAAIVAGALAFGMIQQSAPSASPAGLPLAADPVRGGGLHGTAEFTVAGTYTWVAPVGVHGVLVELWGAGGGGSRPYGYQAAGDGGGSGAFVRTVVPVVPGQGYLLTIGEGGKGAAPPAAFGAPGAHGGDTGFATAFGPVLLTGAGGGFGGHSADDGHGGIADPSAQIHRDGRNGGHGAGITPGAGGKSVLGSLEPPTALAGGAGGVGQINAAGGNGSPGYAILMW